MLVPVRWLSEYVELGDVSIQTLEERLIMSGSNTEGVEKVLGQAKGLTMGVIKSVERHPEAEKLFIIQVDIGEEILQIVTGADNCKPGKYVAVAVNGSRIADNTKIKKGKLRGVESNGMLCSLDEMGFDDKVIPKHFADAIFLFDEEYPLGAMVEEAQLEFKDEVINFEITPNRPDCLSMVGMARETAATFNWPLKLPVVPEASSKTGLADEITLQIDDKDLCPLYSARIIKNIRMVPTPDWMKIRLMKAGMRPINVIVDISNYVMLEMGQPTHAFDLETIRGRKIIVRRAQPGEVLTTLDDVERKLNADTLVIADAEGVIALAGIMGGEATEIKDNTKHILIESANFDKTNIRKSSKDLGLRSEASSRFEKGVSPRLAHEAVNRVCQLIAELNAGDVVDAIAEAVGNEAAMAPVVIKARVERLNQMTGLDLSAAEMVALLERLGLVITIDSEGKTMEVAVPHYRLDLKTEIDLVEEVARLYGYDRIPKTLPNGHEWGARTNGQHLEKVTREALVGDGFYETLTYSFVSPKALDSVGIEEESFLKRQVRLINPLGEEYSVMRTMLLPNAMEILARNYKHKVETARIFELGNLFIPKNLPVNELPYEKKALVISAYGGKEDFFTLKGAVEKLFGKLGIKDVEYITEASHPSFHPGRCATLAVGNHILGTLGEVHPLVTERYGMDCRVYAAEIDFNLIYSLARLDRQFTHLPKYPAITRDIAMLVKDEVSHATIEQFIKQYGGKKLVGVKLFDVYKGKQIEEGHKSVAYQMLYRDAERTLTDEEIQADFNKLISNLEIIGARLR